MDCTCYKTICIEKKGEGGMVTYLRGNGKFWFKFKQATPAHNFTSFAWNALNFGLSFKCFSRKSLNLWLRGHHVTLLTWRISPLLRLTKPSGQFESSFVKSIFPVTCPAILFIPPELLALQSCHGHFCLSPSAASLSTLMMRHRTKICKGR